MVLIERNVVRGRYDAWKLTAYRFVSPKRPAPACPFATVRRPLYGEAKKFLARIMGMIARLPGPVQVALACPTNEHEITLANGSTIESLPLGPGILSPSARW